MAPPAPCHIARERKEKRKLRAAVKEQLQYLFIHVRTPTLHTHTSHYTRTNKPTGTLRYGNRVLEITGNTCSQRARHSPFAEPRERQQTLFKGAQHWGVNLCRAALKHGRQATKQPYQHNTRTFACQEDLKPGGAVPN